MAKRRRLLEEARNEEGRKGRKLEEGPRRGEGRGRLGDLSSQREAGRPNQPEGGWEKYQRASALITGRNAVRHSPSFNYGAVAARGGKEGSGAPRKSNFKSSARSPPRRSN